MAGALLAATVLAAPGAAQAAPSGLFVGDYSTTTISQFTIGAGGALSLNGTAPTGTHSWTLAATPNGKYLYATNNGDGTISQYSIGSGGTLSPLFPATVPTGTTPQQVAVSPDGKNVYVANGGGSVGAGSVTVYGVGSGGTLTLLSTVTTDLSTITPEGLAISPDGSSVYVSGEGASSATNAIVEFNRSSDGSLTPKSSASVPTVTSGTIDLVITPDGQYVYATGANSSVIQEYTVGSGGELTPASGPPVPEGSSNYQLTISPNGKNLYAANCGTTTNSIYQYSIGSGGALSPLSPPAVNSGGTCPELQWMTANGAYLYAPDFNSTSNSSVGDVSMFSVGSGGALSLKGTVPAGAGASDVVIAPDQGPRASFSTSAARVGKATTFNASGSSDSDGTVASYRWNFGDGHSLTTTSAQISHTYTKPGRHTVTLTVTDDSGCSAQLVFTGQTAYCNPTTPTVSHTVKVASATRPLRLSVSPRRAHADVRACYSFRAVSKGHGVKNVKVKLAGHTTRTAGNGTAKLCLKLRRGTYTARASRKGYATAAARITVTTRARVPGFTG
ncbi:MAG TPA: PKD domain-containing protein [Solirubrobacteraceae bacterium]|nr:PKD domain-containing protein [Solirubrobacteraceae bacterium]